MKRVVKLITLLGVLCAIALVNIYISAIVFFTLMSLHLLRKRLAREYTHFIQHSALVNLKRDYAFALIGSNSCFRIRAKKDDCCLNWSLPDLSWDEMRLILYRYYSLVKNEGTIYLYITKNEIQKAISRTNYHPFVLTIIHQWTLPEIKRRTWWGIIISDFVWVIKLCGFNMNIHSAPVPIQANGVYEKIKSLADFLKERDRKLVCVFDDSAMSLLASKLSSSGINSIRFNELNAIVRNH